MRRIRHTALLSADHLVVLYEGGGTCDVSPCTFSVVKMSLHLQVEAPVVLMSVPVETADRESALNSAAPFDGLQRMSRQSGERGERRDDGRAAA